MKYSSSRKSLLRRPLIFFFAIMSILTGLIIALLIAYPIRIKSDATLNNKQWFSKFVVFWPESPLSVEARYRKKLNRFARSEIQRRFDEQLSNMTKINSLIYDFWLDTNLLSNATDEAPSFYNSSFIWPVIPDNRNENFLFDTLAFSKSPFVVIPEITHAKIRKGFYLASGQYIRSTFPFTSGRRYLMLEVLPLNPGNIRATLGQYVWTKTFSPEDVNKPAKFFIPIYDSIGKNYKFINISSSLYILEYKILSINNTARDTIYLPQDSEFWQRIEKSHALNEERDPLTEIANDTVLSPRDTTIAKGYNAFFITIDDFDPKYFNPKILNRLMPQLSILTNHSVIIKENYDASELSDSKLLISSIYQKYGYKTVTFTNGESLNIDQEATSFPEFKSLQKNWLLETDAQFEQQRLPTEKEERRLEGLHAVFKPEPKEKHTGFSGNEIQLLANYFKKINFKNNMLHKFESEENIAVSNTNYSSELIKVFNSWLKPQTQNRIRANIYLNPERSFSRPAIQDGITAFFKKPSLNVSKIRYQSKLYNTDKQLRYMIESIRSEHITHRTILFVILKNKNDVKKSSALIFIPGLTVKNHFINRSVNQKDLQLYAMNLVGIPPKEAVNFYESYKNLESGQNVSLNIDEKHLPNSKTKYTLVVYPNKKCESLNWFAADETIENVQGNFPAYQIHSKSHLEIFPCDFTDNIITLTWFQQKSTSQTQNMLKNARQHIHGYFKKPKKKDTATEIYYGKNLITEENLPFSFAHREKEIDDFFMVEEKEIDQLSSLAIKSFKLMRSDVNLPQNTQASLFITQVNE